jgi:urease accessory protein
MTSPSAGLLVALQHADGLFPSGSFAFSQGLEARAALADYLGPFDIDGFLMAQILHRWTGSDRVALVRAHRLAGDLDAIAALDAEVEASTLSQAFREASRRNGTALLTTHDRLATPGVGVYRAKVRRGHAVGHIAVIQGLVWSAIGLDEATAVLMSGYAAVTTPTAAAVRLGLIGAIEAQAVIARALPLVERSAGAPIADDEPLAAFMPLADIAAARHGVTGLRLFSN